MNSSSSTISTALSEILDSPDSSGLSQTERKAISSFSKAIESGEEITPELFSNFESTPEVPTPPTPPKPTTATHNPPEEFTFPDGSKGTISTSKIDGGIGDIIQNDKEFKNKCWEIRCKIQDQLDKKYGKYKKFALGIGVDDMRKANLITPEMEARIQEIKKEVV